MLPSSQAAPEPVAKPVRIVLVGDSTVTDNAGWGLGFKQFLTDKAGCANTAQGGRSSKSFRDEGRWTKALELKGNYYLIQFGHNNEPGKPGRSTDMPTFVSDMAAYVDEARAAGAIPVLVTPLVRRQWDREHPGKIKSSLEPYAAEVRKIARDKRVPLVDLHARSLALCESLGPDKCLEFSPTKSGTDGAPAYDGTHLNEKGHVLFGRLVAEELRKTVPALTPLLRATPVNDLPKTAESTYDAVVSADGSGTHTTVRDAVNSAPDNGSKPFRILIKPGRYEGPLLIPSAKRSLQFIGEELENTVLTYAKNVKEPEPGGTPMFAGIGVVIQAPDFTAERITFENTSGDHGQALALRVDADRATFRNCRMLGWQDTLMANKGRQYYQNCTIEGRVDFIYGDATAVFDHCTIHSKNGGYVTAASTPAQQAYGFVFFDCKLTGDDIPWNSGNPGETPRSMKKPNAALGRPWRPNASVIYVRCEMGDHIQPEGWNNWGNAANEATARYSEVDCTGPGASTAARVAWVKKLTDSEIANLTVAKILAGTDAWAPQDSAGGSLR
ncbi:pectinesterase family protein [Luteolibacter sp. LG18]|uniref:pectinesterase family protein n=1 Tax=Luteolibacter sp. LG18 TaxID=2819286 RepID=UPI0030C67591